jgi:hypothetical protein
MQQWVASDTGEIHIEKCFLKCLIMIVAAMFNAKSYLMGN